MTSSDVLGWNDGLDLRGLEETADIKLEAPPTTARPAPIPTMRRSGCSLGADLLSDVIQRCDDQ